MYGTSVQAVEAVGKEGGKTCILDIDTQVRINPPSFTLSSHMDHIYREGASI